MRSVFAVLCIVACCHAWLPAVVRSGVSRVHGNQVREESSSAMMVSVEQEDLDTNTSDETTEIPLESLNDMDVVIYSHLEDGGRSKRYFGAMQEDGILSPLSAWSMEPAFGTSVELLVDEEDRFALDTNKIKIEQLLDQSQLSYGSRQCHRG